MTPATRTARPLPPPRTGRLLPRWELTGPAGAPLVVTLGGISAGAHVTSTAGDRSAGWWEQSVGAGRAIDTRRTRVLSLDWLDAGDGVHEAVTTADQADALARVLDTLHVEAVQLVIGASYGAMVALAFGARHRARSQGLVVISGAHASHPFTTGIRAIQRRIVRLGVQSGRGREGVALARALGMTTYRSAEEMAARFAPVLPSRDADGVTFAVERYLVGQGSRSAAHFDARRFLVLSLSADLHRVEPEDVRVPALLVAAEGDTLVPAVQMEELARRLGAPSRLVHLPSRVGHDAFLAEPELVAPVLSSALATGVVP